MAYNLPPAWDAGFVLPKNVRDEGLERRAFVTKMIPRGTYDQPTVGTGGYAVPRYVMDEGYGQGTYTTKWQPSGTYNGPKIPHWLNQRPQLVSTAPIPGGGRQVTIQPMGDVPMPEPFESYGQKAAADLISRVSVLPAGQRQQVLKGILDQFDKSAWSRTNDIFQRYVKQGTPPANAFPLALARALSTGIAAEIIATGIRGTAPQANSLLGLGCYGCMAALGATDVSQVTGGPILSAGTTGATARPPAPVATPATPGALCAPPAGYTWAAATPTVAGHWERLVKGATPVWGPCNPTTGQTIVPVVRDQRPTYDFYVGPFGFNLASLPDRVWAPGQTGSGIANRAAPPDIMYLTPDPNATLPNPPAGSPLRAIAADVIAYLKMRLTQSKDANGKTDTPVYYTGASAIYGYPESDAATWFGAMDITPQTPLRMHDLANLRTAIAPFARTKNPKTGADMILSVSLAKADATKDWDANSNPLALKVWLTRVPDPSVWGELWNPMVFLNPLTGLQVTASIVAGAAGYLSDLACGVMTDPNGKTATQVAAGTVAAMYGVPPQTGVAGANIAASACGQPPPPPTVIAHPKSIVPMLLLGAGAIAAVLIVARKPKKATPSP